MEETKTNNFRKWIRILFPKRERERKKKRSHKLLPATVKRSVCVCVLKCLVSWRLNGSANGMAGTTSTRALPVHPLSYKHLSFCVLLLRSGSSAFVISVLTFWYFSFVTDAKPKWSISPPPKSFWWWALHHVTLFPTHRGYKYTRTYRFLSCIGLCRCQTAC